MGWQTDKIGHGYGPTYQRLAGSYPTGLLVEVGIGDGAGLRYFRDIGLCDSWLGVDHNRNYVDNAKREGFMGICSEQDDVTLPLHLGAAVAEEAIALHLETPKIPTVIVDDGCHYFDKTIATFNNLWPTLAAGGTYIIEDWSHLDEGERYKEWYFSMCEVANQPAGLIPDGIWEIGLIVFRKAPSPLQSGTDHQAGYTIPAAKPGHIGSAV